MPGPSPDPNATRRNKEGRFKTVVRDPDRKVPPFPEVLESAVPIDLWDFVNAYWREVFVTLGDLLQPLHHFTVARAAILYAQVVELGTEVPGVTLTNLSKLEDSFAMSPRSQLALRITVIEKGDEKPGKTPGVKRGPLAVVPTDLASRAG